MQHRILVLVCGLVMAVAVVWLSPVFLGGQAQTGAANGQPWTPPRTADGRPDLEGVWDFATITPLERPVDLGEKEFWTDAEAVALAKLEADRRGRPNPSNAEEVLEDPGFAAAAGAPARPNFGSQFLAYEFRIWWDRGSVAKTKRTSLIIDPKNGRLPPMTPEAEKQAAARRARPVEFLRDLGGGLTSAEADALLRAVDPRGEVMIGANPEDLSVATRCILGLNAGPPITPTTYINQVHIFQTPEQVVLLNEMVHGVRTIPTDGRPHGNIRQWSGDSRGHWEGDTLVVDSINFYDRTSRGSGPNMQLTERFTRVADDTLIYQFTVDDPTTWTRPWTGELPMTLVEDGQLYEYACHEANYSMFGILNGARATERQAAELAEQGRAR